MFKPSKFQEVFYKGLTDTTNNFLLNAKAGSGKTTTIVNAFGFLPVGERAIFLAFNKSVVKELKTRVPDNVIVRTLHGNGANELRFHFKGMELDENKVEKVVLSQSPGWGVEEEELRGYQQRVAQIVDIMRFALPQSREELNEILSRQSVEVYGNEVDWAKEVLIICRRDTRTYDFTDMIYIPATSKTMRVKKFKYVFVDECQDLNRAQQEFLKKIVDPNGGRLIAVGDPGQAIYGFAGADIDAFNSMKTLFPNTVELPLSECYRCGKNIIKHAQEVEPGIEAFSGSPDGEVRRGSFTEATTGDFILCRNTRPLVSLCLQYIMKGQKATIKGGDIGRSLIALINSTKLKTTEPMLKKLEAKVEKLIAKTRTTFPLKDPTKVPSVVNFQDKIAAIAAIADQCKSSRVDDIIERIEQIFTEDTEGIVLSTIHKAKGLEADRVFILECYLMPAAYAEQPWELVQENNLDYVARTRAKKSLIYIEDYVSSGDKRDIERLERSVDSRVPQTETISK